jgi:mono/diheme cytochrome c family protein
VGRRAALAVFALACLVLATGCGAVGRETSGDPSSGKALFLASPGGGKPACGSCHTLANAKSTGTVGPNLDDAFESARMQGFDESTIRDVVRGQIAYPEEPMPANLYEGDDADDVAAYIGKCGGVPTCGVTASKSSTTTTTTGGGGAGGGTPAAQGKSVFSANCASCHTLEAADASGTVGPNLDELKPSKATVQKQVENGGGAMPAFKDTLTPEQISAVATFVASSTGQEQP